MNPAEKLRQAYSKMRNAHISRNRQIQDKRKILENLQNLVKVMQAEIAEDEKEAAQSDMHLREIEKIVSDINQIIR